MALMTMLRRGAGFPSSFSSSWRRSRWCPCFATAASTTRGLQHGSRTMGDDLKSILSLHHTVVQRVDVAELSRLQTRPTFRDFVLRRFDLGILEAQGEESTVRRVVHAHLLLEEPQYRQLLASLVMLPDPFGPLDGTSSTPFQPEFYRITTASQRNSHLAAATTGRAGIAKALVQLGANLDMLRKEEEEVGGNDDLKAKIQEREARVKELNKKLARFDALIQVLVAIEERLANTKAQVLDKWQRRCGGGGGGAGGGGVPDGTNSVMNTTGNNVRLNSHAWGKAVEKEGKEALEACLEEWKQQQQQQGNLVSSSSNDTVPFVLTGVTLQSLDSEEMVQLREDIVQRQYAGIYDGVSPPKAELDALVVFPAPEDPLRLQVVLAVEMKRSLDEVSLDCLKFHLSLEICRQAPPGTVRFSSSGVPKRPRGRETKRGGKGSGWSTQDGYVLDFSTLRLPEDAVYLTKRGGTTLRATSKLMLEQVPLTDKEGEERANVVQQLFYAPDFASDDQADKKAAEVAREKAIDVLYQRFASQGAENLRRRLGSVVKVLTGQDLVEGEEAPRLRGVFVLGKKDG